MEAEGYIDANITLVLKMTVNQAETLRGILNDCDISIVNPVYAKLIAALNEVIARAQAFPK